jgi:hypothetical protein
MLQSEPIPQVSVWTITEYLGVPVDKVETTLKNLADGGYAINVSLCPEKWVRVVPVEVELINGIAWTPPFPEGSRKPTFAETQAAAFSVGPCRC